MREVQIYLKGERIDIFDDITIELSQKIQDAKEIGKIFTDYTRPFEAPASATNNKIFKHFYNFNITTGNFDARVRHEASLYLNHLLFKNGKILLNGVKMKNGKPHTYKLTFIGNTVSLKDVFGDDKLIALTDYTDNTKGLINFDHEFSYTNVKNIFEGEGLQTFSDSSALIYPLITSKKRLFYNTSLLNTDVKNFDGNIYAPSSGNDIDRYHKRGVKPSDLKPAIKVYHIIKAIEEKYNINFIPDDTSGTKDFFSKENPAISNLYLWLSNNSGNITGEIGADEYIYKATVDSWNEDTGDDADTDFLSIDGNEIVIDPYPLATLTTSFPFVGKVTKFFLKIIPSSSYDSVSYRAKLIDSDKGTFQTLEGTGTTDFEVEIPPIETNDDPKRYTVEFYSETPMLDTDIQFRVRVAGRGSLYGDEFDADRYTTGSVIDSDTATVSMNDHLPDIKIIDFLNGFFKMFNLTAYYIDDETDPEYDADTPVVKVITLDDYYADAVNNQSGGTIDITKYVDVTSHDVNTSLPFNEIDFKFEKTDVVLNENHLKISGERFGDSHLPVAKIYPDFFFGNKYEIKVPFSKIKYERLEGTDIQWGYAAGGDFNAEDGDYDDANDITPPKGNYNSVNIKPLLFYGVRHTNISENINFSDDSNTTVSIVNDYYRPSNSNETPADDETPAAFSINFDSEYDEWVRKTEGTNSLFQKFYKKYIESVFDPYKRISVFTAYLPPSFLIHYRLNDQLKIQDEVYRINSIRTNLNTGKSLLELINLNSDEII